MDLTNKFVAVLNEKVPVRVLMNALAHMAARRSENSNQIRKLRGDLAQLGVCFVDFTSTMTVGTYAEQKERTKQTAEADLEYYGICMFGEKETLSELTRKFSLWR